MNAAFVDVSHDSLEDWPSISIGWKLRHPGHEDPSFSETVFNFWNSCFDDFICCVGTHFEVEKG